MTKSEFVDWKDSSVTIELMRMFQEVRDAYADKIIRGDNLGKEILMANDIGIVKGLDFFLNVEFEGNEDED